MTHPLYGFVQEGKAAEKAYKSGLNKRGLKGINSLSKGVRVVIRLAVQKGDSFKLREYCAEVVEVTLDGYVRVKTVGTLIDGDEPTDKIIREDEGPERKLKLKVGFDGTISSTAVKRPDLSGFNVGLGRRVSRPAVDVQVHTCGYVMRSEANRINRQKAQRPEKALAT